MTKSTKPDILCNWCGQTTKLPHGAGDDKFDHDYFYGLIDAGVQGGYHSTPGNGHGTLDDSSTYRFSLCEFCLDHLFSQFAIPPKLYTNNGEEEKLFLPAAQRVKEDHWRSEEYDFSADVAKHAEGRKNVYQYPPTNQKVLNFIKEHSKYNYCRGYGPFSKEDQTFLIAEKLKLDQLFQGLPEEEKSKFTYYSLGLDVDSIPKDSEIHLQSDIDQYKRYLELADSYKTDCKGNPIGYGFIADSHNKEIKKVLNRMYFTLTRAAQKLVGNINRYLHLIPKNP